MKYIQFVFEDINAEQREMLIALLSEQEFEGFEEVDQTLKAFIVHETFNEETFNSVIDVVPVKYSKSIVREMNWNAAWEADFQPVEVFHPTDHTPFAYLRANFHPANPAFKYDLLVTPKMSFGTGHHATTYLMVSQMSELDFAGMTVLDFGTGTGVLAILAEKMGAASVTAIDCDEWSIANAEENFAENGCTKIQLLKAETIPPVIEADILLANINLNIILSNLDAVKAAVKPGGTVLFSGIMLHDEEQILPSITMAGFLIEKVLKRDNWLAILTR